MADFSVIDLADAPEIPGYSPTLPCEACGQPVTRSLSAYRRIMRHPKGRYAAFCNRTCHGRYMGAQNAGRKRK